jgi:hypothetical protein
MLPSITNGGIAFSENFIPFDYYILIYDKYENSILSKSGTP